MKSQISYLKSQILFLLIIILAVIFRFNQLGVNPPALDWDEASLGYNAYSILKTGKDEFGRLWPISIRSFEDYKPAVYTYLTIPSITLFGLNEFAVRLPSALAGILTVIFTYYLVKELLGEKIAILTAFFLAISPWHLQFSRVAFEANVALFFVVSGLWCFLKGLKNPPWFIVSALLLTISFYTYHSPRLVVPLVILGWTWHWRRIIWAQRKFVLVAVIVGTVLLIPFFREAVGKGGARLAAVTVLNPEGRLEESITRIEFDRGRGDSLGALLHNRRVVYTLAVAKGYLDHFNLDFLFLRGDSPDRHHARDMGMLYLIDAPLIFVGMLTLLNKKGSFPLFWWYLVAPAAAAITTGTPHAVRALLYLPIYQIFSAYGLLMIIKYLRRQQNRHTYYISLFMLLGLILVNIFYYLQMYYFQTPIEASKDWNYGYKEAVSKSSQYDSQVDKIIMTYAYDQPHVFVLFYGKIDPAWYQAQVAGVEVKRELREFGKYEFRRIDWAKDQFLTHTLLIGTPGEIPDSATGKVADIRFLDGTVAFRLVKR